MRFHFLLYPLLHSSENKLLQRYSFVVAMYLDSSSPTQIHTLLPETIINVHTIIYEDIHIQTGLQVLFYASMWCCLGIHSLVWKGSSTETIYLGSPAPLSTLMVTVDLVSTSQFPTIPLTKQLYNYSRKSRVNSSIARIHKLRWNRLLVRVIKCWLEFLGVAGYFLVFFISMPAAAAHFKRVREA